MALPARYSQKTVEEILAAIWAMQPRLSLADRLTLGMAGRRAHRRDTKAGDWSEVRIGEGPFLFARKVANLRWSETRKHYALSFDTLPKRDGDARDSSGNRVVTQAARPIRQKGTLNDWWRVAKRPPG